MGIHTAYGATLWVKQIDVEDANTVTAVFSENPDIEVWEIKAEIKILHDMNLRGAVMKEGSNNKVEVFLDSDILSNTKYSILTISGAEGSIDFETSEDVDWFTAFSLEEGDWQEIESIEVVDPRTLLISYAQNLAADSFDYKLLAEKKIQKIEKKSTDDASITITIDPPLASNQDYILMFIDLQDSEGETIEFDTWIYDFRSTQFRESDNDLGEVSREDDLTLEETPETENIDDIPLDQTQELMEDLSDWGDIWTQENNIIPEEVIPNLIEKEDIENMSGTSIDLSEEPELNAAPGEEVSAGSSEDWNINEIASNATVNPQAWAATWVLVLLSVFINTFFYFTRRKKLK